MLPLQLYNFNPRSRVGSDNLSVALPSQTPLFQSTLPCRERLSAHQIWLVLILFQSTLPCRERQIPRGPLKLSEQFQSTLPCRERLQAIFNSGSPDIFQSTLPCRERRFTSAAREADFNFNPRSRVGSDRKRGRGNGVPRMITIHAPV